MNITYYDNITSSNYVDYDNFTSSNYRDLLIDSINLSLSNCTIDENNIDIIIPILLLTIPCGLSILGLLCLMVYTLIKPLIKH